VYAASDGTSIYNIQSLRSRALLAPGVSITAKDADSFSPLHYALKIKQPGAGEILPEAGADPLKSNPDSNSALHLIGSGLCLFDVYDKSFETFPTAGVDRKARKTFGNTPLPELVASVCHPTNNVTHRDRFAIGADGDI